jgi:hypothetical protein
MALFKADLAPEIEQLKTAMSEILAEQVEPAVDRTLTRSVTDVSQVVASASFELQEAIDKLSVEINTQREKAVADAKMLIYRAAGVSLVVLTAAIFIAKWVFTGTLI